MNANSAAEQNRYAPPQAQVGDYASPEAVLEPASRGVRFGAAMIDGLIVTALYIPVIIAVFLNPTPTFDPAVLLSVWGAVSLIGAIALIAVTIVLVKRNGQTIGKKMTGIKVVRADGSKASLGRIFWLRNVVNGIPSAIPLLGYVYVLVDHLLIFSDKRQCLHDKIADTIVVNAQA
jgi:uncharacterized RDD family membrane protein YckC